MSVNAVNLSAEQITSLINGGAVNGASAQQGEDGIFQVTESDGDTYQVNAQGELVGEITNNGTTEEAGSASGTSADLEAKKERNEAVMTKLQEQITALTEEVKKSVDEALAKQESIQEEQKSEINKIMDEQLSAYKDANGEMSLDDFKANVTSAIGSSTSDATKALSSTMRDIMDANGKLNLVDNYLSQMRTLIDENASIDKQIEDAKAAEQQATRCCDPISFEVDGSSFDFIVDDGNFDSSSDFLGATNYFDAMKALDTDGDDKVNKEELEAGNIKLVKDKTEVVDISTLFDDDDYVDLKSYEDTMDVATAKSIVADGEDQAQLGTFGMVLGADNEKIDGESTLDSTEYLNKTYGFNETAATNGENGEANAFESFFNEYSEISAELRGKLNNAYAMLGITEEQVQAYDSASKAQSDIQGQETTEAIQAEVDEEMVAKQETENKEDAETEAKELKEEEELEEEA